MTSDGNDRFTLLVDRTIGKAADKMTAKQAKIFLASLMLLSLGSFMTLLFIYPFSGFFRDHGFGSFESWGLATLVVVGVSAISLAITARGNIVKWVDNEFFAGITDDSLADLQLKLLSNIYNVPVETLLEVQRKSNAEKA